MSLTLFEIIKVSLEKQEIIQVEEYLNRIEEINTKIENKLINLSYRLSKAIILKESKQQRERIKSELLLEEIANEEIIFYSHTIYAMLSLCELYIDELAKTNDKTFLKKLNQLV